MQFRKMKSKVNMLLFLCLVFTGLFTGFFPARSFINAAAIEKTLSSIQSPELSAVSAKAAGAAEEYNVYDDEDNKLYYNRVTGMVFSEIGVVYNQDSQPLTYDDTTHQFEDSLQRRLDLVERSTNGLNNYYLMFGDYKVRSIGLHDELYLVGVAANTKFNSGEAYDMLVTRVYVKYKFLQFQWVIGNYGYYEYYDLHGHKIDSRYLQHTVSPNLIVGAGTSAIGGTKLTKFEKWGTIKDLLNEIVYLMELVPPTGSPMGEFALNTVTGAYLRDDRNQKVRIKDGQLIDPMSWPLIGADARPLWWRENIRAYTNHKGELLEFDNEENKLTDKDGFVAHSVITNVIAGQRIYLVYIYIKDESGVLDANLSGKYLIPATVKTISTNPYKAEFYDMNGVLIPEWELIEPDVSVEDRKENWPDEFSDWWDKLVAFFKSIGSFFKKWGPLILLIIIVVATLPLTVPLLITIFTWLIRGIVQIAKWIAIAFKKLCGGIKTLFTKLFGKGDSP